MKLLTWKERTELLDILSSNNMNFYFYCPKEDVNNRFKWKEQYSRNWLKNLTKFNKYALEKNIKIIVGISPGLDFNFKSYVEGNKEELNVLIKKLEVILSCGVPHVAILFDDIPNEFKLFVKSKLKVKRMLGSLMKQSKNSQCQYLLYLEYILMNYILKIKAI